MYLHVSNTKNGTYLAFYESYRDKAVERQIKNTVNKKYIQIK